MFKTSFPVFKSGNSLFESETQLTIWIEIWRDWGFCGSREAGRDIDALLLQSPKQTEYKRNNKSVSLVHW